MHKFIITLAVVLLQSFWSTGQGFVRQNGDASPQDQGLKKFERALEVINRYYVDSVSNQLLVEQAIIAMLKQLDPHSNYFTAEQIKRVNEDLEGSFDGIGIEFQMIDDTAVVMIVLENGPSAKAGLRPGDKILSIGTEDATGTKSSNNWISKRVRGEKGTTVVLTVRRHGIPNPVEVPITRDKIPTYSVDAFYMLDKSTGYIKVSKFMRTTVQEFEEALTSLQKKDLEDLILDLRGNTGGYLNSAVQLADHFLGRDKIIVYTEGLNSTRIDYKSTGRGQFRRGRLVVLIDENSASASEIFTGAIQDWDRGIVMGRRSFGKGLVQKPYNLPDGSAIRLTIANYYTPTGRSIQRPYDKGRDKYFEEMNEKIRRGIYSNADSMNIHDSLKRTTPNGRVVYGGGGIMPDILVASDTSGEIQFMRALVSKNMFNRYALTMLQTGRDSLLRLYPDVEAYLQNRAPGPAYRERFLAFAAGMGITPGAGELSRSDQHIDRQLAVTLARILYGNKASTQVQGNYDPMIPMALEVIRDASSSSRYNLSQQQDQ